MDIFKTPGASLLGNDKYQFDDLKELIDKGTNDFLIKSDWDSNIQCVDKINSLVGQNTLPEIVFLLRRKLQVREPRQVMLVLQLIESLVKNCGSRFHHAMNDDKFMKEMANVYRRFSTKSIDGCREATDLSLEMIQSWGEAFLPKQNQYAFIVKTYFDLRKEGVHFKDQQFDPNRMPIIMEDTHVKMNRTIAQTNADAILAATMQMQLNDTKSISSAASSDEFSSSFFNSSIYQGNGSGPLTSPQTTRTKQVNNTTKSTTSTHHDERRRDQHHQSSTKSSNARHVSDNVVRTQPGVKRNDSFDPSQYPEYDFNDTGVPAAAIKAPASDSERRQSRSVKPENRRSSFDPSMYPDHDFNDDSIPITKVTANEVIESVSCSLSLLKELILACNHERELRNNEVASEIVQQVTTMEAQMSTVIEQALLNESDKVEQLFALNEDVQAMLNVFNSLITGSMYLPQGKSRLQKINIIVKEATPKKPVVQQQLDLLGLDENNSPHYAESNRHTRAQNATHTHASVAQHQVKPVEAHQKQQPQHSAPQQQQQQQQQQHSAPQQQHSTSQKSAFKLKPPPKVDSIYGNALKATSSDIIEVGLTSSTDLDILFEDPAVVKQRSTPLTQTTQTTQTTHSGPVKFDPFSNDNLDALFEKPKPRSATVPVNSQPTRPVADQSAKKFDPFSNDALDALFDYNPRAPHSDHHPKHTQRTPSPHQSQQKQVHYPPSPYAPHQYAPQGHSNHHGQGPPPGGHGHVHPNGNRVPSPSHHKSPTQLQYCQRVPSPSQNYPSTHYDQRAPSPSQHKSQPQRAPSPSQTQYGQPGAYGQPMPPYVSPPHGGAPYYPQYQQQGQYPPQQYQSHHSQQYQQQHHVQHPPPPPHGYAYATDGYAPHPPVHVSHPRNNNPFDHHYENA